MYQVIWDEETGGIRLTDNPDGLSGELRPVFHEELDLLGFGEGGWSYPCVPEGPPLLWAVGRRYYYRGRLVANARGGGFYERPILTFHERDLQLEPVDLEEMTQRNAGFMSGLVFRALEFIRREYEQRRDRVDIAAVAFSGGKDSLVLLDLVQRALPPDCFEVVFNDTTMELSVTHEAVKRARLRWPSLRFHTTRPHRTAAELWDALGPPSRVIRWCCTALKSGPTVFLLRRLTGKKRARVLILDGCRSLEGARRSTYRKVSEGAKHLVQTNLSPLLDWCAAEIFLYAFARGVLLNDGYRQGFARVGCAVCPLASNWWDFVASQLERECIEPFTDRISALARDKGVPPEQVTAYVSEGGWRGRMGGQYLRTGGNRVMLSDELDRIVFRLRAPSSDWQEWAKAFGERHSEGPESGTIVPRGSTAPCSYIIRHHGPHLEVEIGGMRGADRFLRRDLKAVFYKAAYCAGCRACEVECPVGALTLNGTPRIDEAACISCGQCLTFIEKGCWAAKSLSVTEAGSIMKLRTYQHFGMRAEWLAEFLADPSIWWHRNTLGPRQFEAMRAWLLDASIVAANMITPLGEHLVRLGPSEPLTWLVIWTNLCARSSLISWYVREIPWGSVTTKAELAGALPERYAMSTRRNGVTALVSLLRDTPLGADLGLGRVALDGRVTKDISKLGVAGPPPIAVLYSLYHLAELCGRTGFSVQELIKTQDGGPVLEMGIAPETFNATLRGLASRYPELLRLELARDLDNVYLHQGRRAHEVLELCD